MANDIHKKHLFARLAYYRKISDISLDDPLNYNIQAQRALKALLKEPSTFLRWHAYNSFHAMMYQHPEFINNQTMVEYIKLLSHERNMYLRGAQFATLVERYTGGGLLGIRLGEQFRSATIKDAFKDALFYEQQAIKPLAAHSRERRSRNVIVGYLQGIVDTFNQNEAGPRQPPSGGRQTKAGACSKGPGRDRHGLG